MKKDNNNSCQSESSFRFSFLSKMKSGFKKSRKKTLGKIGLFLIFGMMVMNVSFQRECIPNNQSEINSINLKTNILSTVKAAEGDAWYAGGMFTALGKLYDDVTDAVVEKAAEDAGRAATASTNWALNGVDKLVKKLVKTMGEFIDTVLKQEFFNALVRDNTSVYKGWTAVRDILNMFFMLLLLFSAFATIFQVEKYHLKKMIVMLIVMALLVNFSFPISRFIVDFSNSAMYFILDSAFGDSQSSTAKMADIFNYGAVVQKTSSTSIPNTMTSQLMTLIFDFILLVSFIAIWINLLIRILAFMILIILSPAGFTFAFFPGTKDIADKWWSALFKYSFLGPVMAFFLYLAMLIFANTNSSSVISKLSFTGTVIIYMVPIVFLWMGLVISLQFGGEYGSNFAMGLARKTRDKINGYGKNAFEYGKGAVWGTTKAVGRGADMVSGYKFSGAMGGLKAVKNSWDEAYKKGSERKQTQAAAYLGVPGANEKAVQDTRKKWKDAGGVDEDEMKKIDKNGTKAEKMALALERAENVGFDKDSSEAMKQYQEGLNILGGNKVYKKLFEKNVTKKNIDLEIQAKISEETKTKGNLSDNDLSKIASDSFKKLDANNWKDQNIERILKLNEVIKNDVIKNAGKRVIDSYSDSARNKMTSEMNGEKYAQGAGKLWA